MPNFFVLGCLKVGEKCRGGGGVGIMIAKIMLHKP